MKEATKLGLDCSIAARKKLFFEELLIVQATKYLLHSKH